MKRQVLEIIDNAPPGHFGPKLKQHLPEVKRQMAKLADRIDDLGRLDEATGEVFIDENSLRKLLREASVGSEDAVIDRLRQFPDHKIRTKPGKRIPWETLAERMEPGAVPAELETDRRFSPYSSLEEVRQGVQRQSADIPDAAFDGDTLYQGLRAFLDAPGRSSDQPEATGRGPAWWDCIVRKLGWFAAMMVCVLAAIVMVVVAAVSIVAPGVAVLTAAWWPLFWALWAALAPAGILAGNLVGSFILLIVCIANPAA